MYFNALLVNAH